MKPNRTVITIDLLVAATFAMFATLSPRALYLAESLVISYVVPVYCDVEIDRTDVVLVGIALCFWLYLAHKCHRASAVVAELKRRAYVAEPASLSDVIGHTSVPMPLTAGLVSLLMMPVWLAPLVASFGKWAAMAASVWWVVIALSTLTYVGALCVVEAECRGEKPSAALLSAGYNLGGAPGVLLAHRSAPRSRALAEMVRFPPIAAVFFGAVVVITVLIKMS